MGLANPLSKRFRTGLLLGMYALVVFVLVFMAVFAAVFEAQAPQITAETGAGYDMRVDSNPGNPLTVDQLQREAGVELVAPLVRSEAQFQTDPNGEASTERLTGFDDTLLVHGGPVLSSRDGRFASDEAAWRAVLASRDLVIVPANFLASASGPARNTVRVGQQSSVINPGTGRRHTVTIVGVDGSLDPAENGAMVGSGNLPTFVDRTSASRFYVTAANDSTPDDLASRLQTTFVGQGTKADTFASLVDERLRAQTQFIALLEGFLSLGLLIGIAGLGVVMVRAVRERRREIGVLRAIGVSAAVVRRAFLIEATFIAVQGIVIGGTLGIVTGYSVLSHSSTFGGEALPFTVPWVALLALAAAALAASLLAVLAPATQASRIRPAIALRIAD